MNGQWIRVVVFLSLFGVAATTSQAPGLNYVMREKLTRAQKILEAVVTSDWVALESETRALEALTNDPRWAVLKAPEYAEQSIAFSLAVQDLHQAAVQRDLEQTPQSYNAVTLRCIECHRFIARERIVR
jgi:hypothetical protein